MAGVDKTPAICANPGRSYAVFAAGLVLRRKKKAPGKATSQGGKGHYSFPGAIGRPVWPNALPAKMIAYNERRFLKNRSVPHASMRR